MKRLILPASFAAFSALANMGIAAVDSQAQSMTTVTRAGTATTIFSCGRESSQACHYLILSSLCQEKLLADGIKERTCSYSKAVPSFQLQAGEMKTITNLPADFLYTMKLGRIPTFQDCITAPIPH